MIFPHSDGQPRHPSQLYEAGLEGFLLGLLMYLFWWRGWLGALGRLTGVFLFAYGLARFFVEFVRQPDGHIHFGIFSIGQLLSLPMIIVGPFTTPKLAPRLRRWQTIKLKTRHCLIK